MVLQGGPRSVVSVGPHCPVGMGKSPSKGCPWGLTKDGGICLCYPWNIIFLYKSSSWFCKKSSIYNCKSLYSSFPPKFHCSLAACCINYTQISSFLVLSYSYVCMCVILILLTPDYIILDLLQSELFCTMCLGYLYLFVSSHAGLLYSAEELHGPPSCGRLYFVLSTSPPTEGHIGSFSLHSLSPLPFRSFFLFPRFVFALAIVL